MGEAAIADMGILNKSENIDCEIIVPDKDYDNLINSINNLIEKNDIKMKFNEKLGLMKRVLNPLGYDTDVIYKNALHSDVCKYSHCKKEDHLNHITESIILPNSPNKYLEQIKPVYNASQIIDWLNNIPQPEQRTPEWFSYRNNVLTASSLSNVFEKKASAHYNELLEEKVLCDRKPITGKALQKGIRNEPIAQEIYERKTKTKITEYGCIRHKKYNYLGASPDGIVTETESESEIYMGRMLEIKCVLSRILYGIPLWKYWVQCQLQMEVCDLEYCDFFECQIDENSTEDEFFEYVKSTSDETDKYYGITIEYSESDENNKSKIKYVYSKMNDTYINLKEWYENEITKYEDGAEYSKRWYLNTYFWKLNKYSLMTIKRDRIWFNKVNPELKQFWDKVENDRKIIKEKPELKRELFPEKVKRRKVYHPPPDVCLIDDDE
tara:strand:+ start:4200 stop:5513 length:1314 start_codon:yes stop_codon:yes gene_type:complete